MTETAPQVSRDVLVETFQASDNYRFHYRHWQPDAARPAGYVVALHGIQSHSGWYEYSSDKLAEAGFEVFFLDRRGSGLNDAHRGRAVHHERLVNDVVQFLRFVRHRRNMAAPSRPVILHAVSWGAKLAVATSLHRPELVDGLSLLYPGIRTKIGPSVLDRVKLWLAGRLGLRERRVPIPLDDPALFTSETKWQRFISEDPLALHEVTVSFLLATRELDRLCESAPPRLRCPLMMMLAGEDDIVDNDAMRSWFALCASSRKECREYPRARHTLEFEPDRDDHIAALIEWMQGLDASG